MRVAALIGSPVAHSLSPAIHNAAFAASGLDWVYVAFDVAPGTAADALAAMRALGIVGLSVTTPHKEDVAAGVDRLAPSATTLRSVNTVVKDGDGTLVGHSTDGDGFVAALAARGVDVEGSRVCLLGAGAAARSVVDALGRAGAADITIVSRTADRAQRAASCATVAHVGSMADLPRADLVVNATSIGTGTADLPADPALLRPQHVVADLVYHPLTTAWLTAAEAAGCTVVDGLSMLVHQAVLQQELWTGKRPDAEAMRAAAERELSVRAEDPGRRPSARSGSCR